MQQHGGVLDTPRRPPGTRAQRVVSTVVLVVLLGVLGVGDWFLRIGGPGPCGDHELLSTEEVEHLLGLPVLTTESLSGTGCTYLVGGGQVLRVHLPTEYSERELAGLRALDLRAVGDGRATVGPPDGAGRASYASTARGETLTASYGGMQLVLALRWSPPDDPAEARRGMARVAAGFIARLTPETTGRGGTPPPPYPGGDQGSPSRDVCPEVVTVAQLEERTGLLVNYSERDVDPPFTDCRFAVDEPATIDIGVTITDGAGQRTAADVAALRQIDLGAAPVVNLDETADEDWPQQGATCTVRSNSSGLPDSFSLKAQAGTTRVEVWYSLRDPDEGAGAVSEVRPGLLALAGQVIANL
jgi:hypothetical protein